jgi:hypothetical protein
VTRWPRAAGAGGGGVTPAPSRVRWSWLGMLLGIGGGLSPALPISPSWHTKGRGVSPPATSRHISRTGPAASLPSPDRASQSALAAQLAVADRKRVEKSPADIDASRSAVALSPPLSTKAHALTQRPWLAPHQESPPNNTGLATSSRIPRPAR